jgi:hypothetical protein
VAFGEFEKAGHWNSRRDPFCGGANDTRRGLRAY